MGKAAAARKLAAAAAFGGGGLTAAGGGLYGLLRLEAAMARKRIGNATGTPPDATGWYGRNRPGPAIKVALIGDSSAAGYGVDGVIETPGAVLASGLSERADRRVYLRSFAVVGARSSDLAAQVEAALPIEPEVAVILIGANDVTHRVPPKSSVRLLSEAVNRLRSADIQVIVGTCPDLGTIKPIQPPLKQVARSWSRRLAAAQAIAVVEADGRTVSLSSILGPEFAADTAAFFGPDQFHPSAEGYASMASVLLPSVLAALDLIPEEQILPETRRGEGVLPIARAAVQAAKTPGTELGGTEVGGSRRGVRGLWVALRHRQQGPRPDTQAPESDESGREIPTADQRSDSMDGRPARS
ncbi:SGNH/GDSL hydrolase family protein [Nocardioides alcanivorans]|uniref:SGNH/GDSL hydrolase family protein n=1 Tax=Nocardioides alcanivorans TaxID=2897352 RepID=UPI001F276B01|nr:SGNH/GDSL hydrolase family protein [Nocardioides alcanivorans]